MAKSTSINLSDHFVGFIDGQVKSGRFSSASEVVREALRLLEERNERLEELRLALSEGERSGASTPLDIAEIKGKARARARGSRAA